MPFCPLCKSEFRDDITMCPDCDTSLVSELEVINEERESSVPCFSAEDYVTVDVVCSALRDSGIDCEIVKSGRPDYKAWTMDDYPATYYVIVPESRQAEARGIITEVLGSA